MDDLTLRRPKRSRQIISLVPMIDVMMILLVFFMVTSTYLDLDMIPAVQAGETGGQTADDGTAQTLMIGLGADGAPRLRGRPVSAGELETTLRAALAAEPLMQIVVLPSGAASTQALITVMDSAAKAGATRLRVIRLEARQ